MEDLLNENKIEVKESLVKKESVLRIDLRLTRKINKKGQARKVSKQQRVEL